ncbi:DNA alkylation repair protein [Humisphaera borealis]|uniref:DNA alkylation repair protein n=1 Tax=Humisphaera borealis TaxID=2807512 RepID=A0A7M2WSB6_9BACT|nr:DNA alkylation repair protein [Humisphaera borealis]QOV88309.1 DNA alkylation repair protein [Humisphaera borealis]
MPNAGPAARISAIPQDVLIRLNNGTMAARNLVEGLAVDFQKLMQAVAPGVRPESLASIDPALGITRRMALAAQCLLDHSKPKDLRKLSQSPSDTVRGWAAYVVGLTPGISLEDRLSRIRPLADDPHFGVREWAWLAVRPHVAANIEAAISLLTPWTADASPAIRRFASEVTRPRGVWCSHINLLKTTPELALPILEPLRADGEKYVQDSVANWLNDAGKSQPKWVKTLCKRWQKDSKSLATARICKRAMRSL